MIEEKEKRKKKNEIQKLINYEIPFIKRNVSNCLFIS